jgi:hypothetical protein
MTDDKIALQDLLKKSSDARLLHEMIGFVAQRLMALETDALCGAGHGDRRNASANDEHATTLHAPGDSRLRQRQCNRQPACRDNLTAPPTRVAGASLQQHALRHDLSTQSNELRGRLNHKPSRPAQRVLLAPY